MRDFSQWITQVAPDLATELAGELADGFEQLDQLIADYLLKMHSPTEFSSRTDEIEATLRGSWDDQVDSGVIDEMLAEFYETRKHGEAATLLRQLRQLASRPDQKPPMEGVA